MKLIFTIHMIQLAKKGTLALVGLVMFGVVSPLAFADGGTWSLDSTASSARFFQGSAANPDSVNTGVARVTGKVKLDPSNLRNSVFDLNIFPADEDWAHALSPEGTLPAGYIPDATDHTLLTFHSRRILRIGDGKLEVIGDLTLTRVERSETLTPSEAYAGPVYGDPVIRSQTREISFLLPRLGTATSSGSLISVALRTKGTLDLSGSSRVVHEDFPDLLNAIQDTNWPTVVKDERCQMPSTVGDDYHGATCTGTVIAATRADNCSMPATVGEDYSGPICTPPSGNQTTIELNLKMLPTSSTAVAEMRSGNGTAR
jgi:polyisoprenoid-binding protein YceI